MTNIRCFSPHCNAVTIYNTFVEESKFYVGLIISYIGVSNSYVELIISYVGVTNSYVGLIISYVGVTISNVGLKYFFHLALGRFHTFYNVYYF